MSSLSLIISASESDKSSKREDSIMDQQVKVNLVELFKEIFNEFGHIMERNGIRNEEWLALQHYEIFCENEICSCWSPETDPDKKHHDLLHTIFHSFYG